MNAAYCFIYKINAERQTGSSETIDKTCCGAKRCTARHPRRRRPYGASRRPNRRPSQQPDILPPFSGGEHVTASSREGTRRHDGPMGGTGSAIRSAPQERNLAEHAGRVPRRQPTDAADSIVWPDDEWDSIALNYTSGTTGNPKGAVYHH